MLSLDTETSGKDLFHTPTGPFFVTTCDDEGNQKYWEWDVDPLTRKIKAPKQDIEEIQTLLDVQGKWGSFDPDTIERHTLILQNPKFDASALLAIGIERFPWSMVRCTLMAGHLLNSGVPHDLTSMALQYLGQDIAPYEDRLEKVVKECRRIVQSRKVGNKYKDWRIVRDGLPEAPSARTGNSKEDRSWKYDCWLPLAFVKDGYDKEGSQDWDTVLRDYANVDSAVTMALWKTMREEIIQRGLWEIYLDRLKVLPIAQAMEAARPVGVTVSMPRLEKVMAEFQTKSKEASKVCIGIACNKEYSLELPRAGCNKSLNEFVFKHLKLQGIKFSEKTNAPSLDKDTMRAWTLTLPEGEALTFIKALETKRKRDTAINYLEGYRRYMLPIDPALPGWYILHPNFNPTGTSTLRWSSNNPNSQNIGKGEIEGEEEAYSLRYCFGPLPGWEWWSLDAKNIELRIPAYESGEEDLIDLFERPDAPPYYGSQHLLNFSVVYPDIWAQELKEVGEEKVGPHCKKKYAATWYQWCKNGDFAIQYNCGRATADRSFRREGSFDKLKSRFSKLEALNQKYIRMAERYGYVETIPDRSINPQRGYPLICTRTEYGRIKPTVPLNYHVQSTAMHWTTKAMVRCEEQLAEWRTRGFDARLVMQVHDECVFAMPRKGDPRNDYDPKRPAGLKLMRTSNLWRVRVLQGIMARGGDDIGIPTPVGAEWHQEHWGQGVTL